MRRDRTFELNGAVATPFAASGRIDHARLAALIRRLLGQRVRTVALLGTTSEGPSIANAEAILAVVTLQRRRRVTHDPP